jgi:hypothetical protein
VGPELARCVHLRKNLENHGSVVLATQKIRTRSSSRPFEALSLTEASAIIIKGGALEAQVQNQSAKPSLLIEFF